jgi:hypothetical protein
MKDTDDPRRPTHSCRHGRHATDSIRFVSYLGRPALYINRGVALVRGAVMENGVLDRRLGLLGTARCARRRQVTGRVIAALALIVTTGLVAEARGQTLPAISEVVNGHTEPVTYRDVRAVKLVPAPETAGKDEDMMALLDGADFKAARYNSMSPDHRDPECPRTHADSSVSVFAPGRMARVPTCSICGRPTDERPISSDAITPCNMCPTRSFPGTVFGGRDCSACIDRVGTIGVLPQSLTPPARATPSLVQGACAAFPGTSGAGGGRCSRSAPQ